mgnify:FL=1
MSKLLVVGDLHWKDRLGYADVIHDGRKAEKQQVLDVIVEMAKGCDKVIFMGDQLNGRNNPSEVIREFVEFIERFGKKEIFIISGNHEKTGDGKSAIDFMREVNKKNWHIITNEVTKIGEDVFVPYFYKGELGCHDNVEASKALMEMIPAGENLFIHHAVSGYTFKSIVTDMLKEPILPISITKKFKRVFCGHIHVPGKTDKNKVIYTGSVFTNEVNEDKKYVYWLEDDLVTDIILPCRPIIKIENPTKDDLMDLERNHIVKAVFSKKYKEEELAVVKDLIRKRFDGHVIVDDFKTERKNIKIKDGDLDLDIKNLLTIYAKERNIDLQKLLDGWDLIK